MRRATQHQWQQHHGAPPLRVATLQAIPSVVVQQGPQSVAPVPRRMGADYEGGPRPRTPPSVHVERTKHLGPRRTCVANVHKCTGVGSHARCWRRGTPKSLKHSHNSNQHNLSLKPSPNPCPSPGPSVPPSRACDQEGEGGYEGRSADGTAVTMRYLATAVPNLWYGPYTI